MAWFAIDLDGTLVSKELDPMTGQEVTVPIEGAVEAMHELAAAGHRLTVFTARFAPMPASRRNELKQSIEAELRGLGFPEMEVWTGTTKPDADIFIGDNNVTFDGDWGLALAQAQTMLEERGLVDIPPDDGLMPDEVEQEYDPNLAMAPPEEIQ
jgi:hypothetical protein